ncbi:MULTISPECIES: DUF3383 family protein [unclassified Acinetobacter]|uniref:DUF3383 family protein n=1 Tax=unclassified Acinetobacter TaxID=196816 RepID=UPI00244C7349|nr:MULTISPECIES: DUF3383 family protein [unclassified Acinetobacter]MDH0030318.1 DUF3383 domain-containing protein [Acinetobacter sp. GD04021]MDH0885886.1 DUF3383 domain-containing protein [Acinetobacter sp. GD03873]MDH1082506.1 DUF3383 domain-containing protein [Acinetobacter sp. GD03983]MDH2189102.1 DUF3383 domain-containing protein [Acinetobacter sp. GD03645]MDH2202290.1 DUF3383 domain-containing protein [Acinetobacter sp. GD03647]
MTAALPVDLVVNVQISLTPQAAQTRSFGSLLILGSTPVITESERIRPYSSIAEVGEDFGLTDPEYSAAIKFFAQNPRPTTVYIGRWVQAGDEENPPETLLEAVQACADASNAWYALAVAAPIATDNDIIAVSEFIEASVPSRIVGFATQVDAVKTPATDNAEPTDIAYKLKKKNFERTLIQYSSDSPYAVVSLLARALSVNFLGNNTAITLKFKQQPTIAAEYLRTSEAMTLKGKNCNVFAEYNNDTAIIQEGVMCSGTFIDERHGLDWLQNYLQTAIWNLQYTSPTKIPQTEGGMNRYCAVLEDGLEQSVTNGLVAPGVWNGDSFGILKTGDYLSKGYYVYSNPIDDQNQVDREGRIAPPIQIAIKLAGAIHFADVLVNVNR